MLFWTITMWSASPLLHLVAFSSLRYNPNKEERNGLPSAEKIPRLPCSWAACLGADGEDKTQCSSRRLSSKQFALNVMWSSINDTETLVLIRSGITSSAKRVCMWVRCYHGAHPLACASLQHVCLHPQLWTWEAKASRRFWRYVGKDRVGLWQCRCLDWHGSWWGTLSRANACGCAPAPALPTGSLLGGDPFARMYWISSGTRSFLCALSGDKVHVSESINAFLQGLLCACCSPVGKAGGRASSYRGKPALPSPHGPGSTEWGRVSHRTLTSPARQRWTCGSPRL